MGAGCLPSGALRGGGRPGCAGYIYQEDLARRRGGMRALRPGLGVLSLREQGSGLWEAGRSAEGRGGQAWRRAALRAEVLERRWRARVCGVAARARRTAQFQPS